MVLIAAAVPFLFVLFLFFDGPAFVLETISAWLGQHMPEQQEGDWHYNKNVNAWYCKHGNSTCNQCNSHK